MTHVNDKMLPKSQWQTSVKNISDTCPTKCHGIRAKFCQLYVTDLCKQGLWIFFGVTGENEYFLVYLSSFLSLPLITAFFSKFQGFLFFKLQNFQAIANREPTKPGTIMSLRSNN